MTYAEFRKRYQWNVKTDKLGEGGFGKVYRATDTLRNRLVVLKIADVPVDHKFSLQREVDLNRDLSAHPNIVQYRNCYRLEDEYGEERDYATMDYFNEGSLTTVMKRHDLTGADKWDIITGMLRGLAHLESEKVIHRDFKPGNVLMVRSDSGTWLPKIADFGLSRFSNSEATETNSSVGISYDYAAPEQFRAGTINQQADLWAAGVIFYQLLTGELPFAVQPDLTGESRRLELIRRIEQAELPTRLNYFTEPYQTIVRRCLVKELSSRVKSANELLDLVAKPYVQPAYVSSEQADPEMIVQPKATSIRQEEVKTVVQEKVAPGQQEEAETVLRPMNVETQPDSETALTTPITSTVNEPVEPEGTALDWEQEASHKKNRFLVWALVVGSFCLTGSYFIWQRTANQGIQSRGIFDAGALSALASDSIIPDKPNPPRLVNDFVGILSSSAERTQLEQRLRTYNDAGTAQIVLVIVKTTAPYLIKDFAVSIGKKWGVGDAAKNNGVVIAWSTQDRKIFIATGYGIEKVVPDSAVKNIIDQIIAPNFKQERYYQGLSEGAGAMIKRIVDPKSVSFKMEPTTTTLSSVTTAYSDTWTRQISSYLNDTSLPEGKVFPLQRINFNLGSILTTPNSQTAIGELITLLKSYPRLSIQLIGYANDAKGDLTNKSLSFKRVNQIKDQLISSGIDFARVDALGRGTDGAEKDIPEMEKSSFQKIDLKVITK